MTVKVGIEVEAIDYKLKLFGRSCLARKGRLLSLTPLVKKKTSLNAAAQLQTAKEKESRY